MKKILLFTMILITLIACTVAVRAIIGYFSIDQATSDSTPTEEPQAGLPNPAAVYCTQNGYDYEIQTADDGSQTGICIFPDGSTCDDWAYYRRECGPVTQKTPTPAITIEATINASGGYMAPGTSEEIADWWGVIKSTDSGAQYDDYFERRDLGLNFIYFGIDSLDQNVIEQISALRDSGKIVHLYGTLFSNVPDYNGSQVQVDRIEVEG